MDVLAASAMVLASARIEFEVVSKNSDVPLLDSNNVDANESIRVHPNGTAKLCRACLRSSASVIAHLMKGSKLSGSELRWEEERKSIVCFSSASLIMHGEPRSSYAEPPNVSGR